MVQTTEQFFFPNLNSSIKKLTPEVIEQIVTDYNEGVSIREIRTKYKEISSAGLYNQLPYSISDESCEKCENTIYTKIENNSRKEAEIHKLCVNCGHDYSDECKCRICIDERKKEEEKKNSIAEKRWCKYYQEHYDIGYTLEDISIYDEINLYVIIRRFYKNNFKFLNFNSIFYSSDPVFISNIKMFVDRKILISNKDIFLEPFPEVYLEKAINPNNNLNWILNIHNQDNELITIQEFVDYMGNKTYTNEDKHLLWKDIYYHELSCYIANQSEMHLKRTHIDAMVREYVCDLLIVNYPLSKAFAIVYYAIGSTMRYMNTYPTNETKINSRFRNSITELVTKRDPKTIKDFNRPSDNLNSVYNDYILKEVLNIQHNFFFLPTEKALNVTAK